MVYQPQALLAMTRFRLSQLNQRGFTLIELMVTVAIGAILMMVAIPSFDSYKRNAELTSASNSLIAGINAARSEAMKKGTNAMVVPTGNGASWNAGWVAFSLGATNTSQTFNTATDSLVSMQEALPSHFTVTGSTGSSAADATAPYIMFDASGYSKLKTSGFGALTLSITRSDLTGAELYEQTRRVKISSVGRVRVCKPKSATDVDCSASTND